MRTKVLFVIVFALFALSACGGAPETVDPDPVTVQLKWIHQAQFAGFYVAQEQGFYDEENLDVTLIPAGVGINAIDNVVDKTAMFGVGGADTIIVEHANGAPIVALATTYRINPFVLVAFADTGIRSPNDFVGRTVSITDGYGDIIQLSGMLRQADVDPDDVTVVPYTYDYTPFLEGELDVMNSFAAGSLLTLLEEVGDREVNVIWPGDYGVHVYSDTIFALEELVENDPHLVVRFLRATLRGHQYAIENPDVALEATMIYAEVQDRDAQAEMLAASAPLIHTGVDEIGWMSDDVWADMHDFLLEQEFIEEGLEIRDVYTTEFLDVIYGPGS